MTRLRATHTGTLFDGLLDCYVLEDEQRVLSRNGMARSLSGVTGSVSLDRFLERIPGGSAVLSSLPVLEFSLPGGGVAKGIPAELVVDVLQLYTAALEAGTLHTQQMPVAIRAVKMLSALAKVGIIALVDEATGYERVKHASDLSFAFRAILLESASPWNLMWPREFVEAMCKLHGEAWDGGSQPRWLASTYDKLYHLILGDEACAELKRRNPDPSFGTNHHQWLSPEARAVVEKQVPILIALGETVGSKEEFWARVEHRYAKRPLQLTWLSPTRKKPDDNEDPPKAAE